jgi:hypothetical protein
MRRLVLVLVVLAGLAGPAAAQRSPDFATLDRGDGLGHIGLDLAWIKLDPPPYDSVFHLDLHGQYVLQSGLGFYAALPFNKSFGDGPDEGELDGEAALADLDLGGLYVISGPDLSWVFRLGLVIPTAGEDLAEFSTNIRGANFRLTDLALVDPNDWWLRLSFSPLFHANRLFLRIDLGVDIPVAEDDEDLYRSDPIGRLNVGAGIDLDVAAIMVEMVNIVDIDDDDNDPDDGDEDVFTNVAATVRFMGEVLQPYISVGTPIDKAIRDQVDLFIAGGIQGVLR